MERERLSPPAGSFLRLHLCSRAALVLSLKPPSLTFPSPPDVPLAQRGQPDPSSPLSPGLNQPCPCWALLELRAGVPQLLVAPSHGRRVSNLCLLCRGEINPSFHFFISAVRCEATPQNQLLNKHWCLHKSQCLCKISHYFGSRDLGTASLHTKSP